MPQKYSSSKYRKDVAYSTAGSVHQTFPSYTTGGCIDCLASEHVVSMAQYKIVPLVTLGIIHLYITRKRCMNGILSTFRSRRGLHAVCIEVFCAGNMYYFIELRWVWLPTTTDQLPGHCHVFLGMPRYSHSASLRPGVQTGTGELNDGGNPATDWHPIQGGVPSTIFLVASCYSYKLWLCGPYWPDANVIQNSTTS